MEKLVEGVSALTSIDKNNNDAVLKLTQALLSIQSIVEDTLNSINNKSETQSIVSDIVDDIVTKSVDQKASLNEDDLINCLTNLDISDGQNQSIDKNEKIYKGDTISVARDEELYGLISSVDIKLKSNNGDEASIPSWLERNLEQGARIKLGHGLEKYFTNCISKLTTLKNIRKPNSKGAKERDILFMNETEKIIYYTEVKCNMNLDTEKSKSTYMKCLQIENELKEEFPDYKIQWCLFTPRYLHYKDMPVYLAKKYDAIKDNLYGVNQFFEMFGISKTLEEQEYKNLLNKMIDSWYQ